MIAGSQAPLRLEEEEFLGGVLYEGGVFLIGHLGKHFIVILRNSEIGVSVLRIV